MPARNINHDAVVQALRDDGWTITHDPLLITSGDRRLFIDLGAERATIGAERGGERIAVEVVADVRLRVLVFDARQQKVVRWIR